MSQKILVIGFCEKLGICEQFIKIKFHDFVQTTVEMISTSIDVENFKILCEEGYARGEKPVRLLGVGVKVSPHVVTEAKESQRDQLSLIPEQESGKER